MIEEPIYDYTLRFYNFACSLSESIAGYLPLNINKPRLENNLVYTCMTEDAYETERKKRKIKGVPYSELPAKFYKMQQRRLLLPYKWQKIATLYADPKIKFIIFPIICKKKGLCDKSDIKKHTLLLIYNKTLAQFESWDDLFGISQSAFSTHRLLRTNESEFINVYLTSVLKEHFHFKFDNETIAVPKFKENVFEKIKNTLEKEYYNNDYKTVYSAYLVDYMKRRIANPGKPYDKLFDAIDFKNLGKYLNQLIQFNNQWKMSHRCDNPLKILNTMTGYCIKLESPIGKQLMGIKKVCGNGPSGPSILNADSKRCKKINLNMHFINYKKKEFLESHALWDTTYIANIFTYFMKKYPYLATNPHDFSFEWETPLEKKAWKLTPPKDYIKITRDAMIDSNIRFIVWFININQDTHDDYHSNCLLIDKETRTIERYEPNDTKNTWDAFNNGPELDDAVIHAFKEFNLEYIPMLKTCPYGFQTLEGREDSDKIVHFGGNCALWTMWYMDLRLSNPLIPRDILVKQAWKELVKLGAFKIFINGYHDYLLYIAKKRK